MPLKPLSDPIDDEVPARVVEAVLACRRSDGTYCRVQTDDQGRFVMAGGGGGGGGDVTVLNWPPGFDINNWPTGFLAQVVNWPGSQAVTGQFWQATQPVSIAAPVGVTGTFWQATQPVSGPLTDAQLRASGVPVTGPITDAQLRAAPVQVAGSFSSSPQPSTLCVTATAAISQAVTANLPAAGVGLFHYITAIDISSYAGAAIATAAGAVTITTTNLPGNPVFNHQRLHAAGASFQSGLRLASNPLKSSAANAATTVVCPVLTGCIWRVNVTYYTGP